MEAPVPLRPVAELEPVPSEVAAPDGSPEAGDTPADGGTASAAAEAGQAPVVDGDAAGGGGVLHRLPVGPPLMEAPVPLRPQAEGQAGAGGAGADPDGPAAGLSAPWAQGPDLPETGALAPLAAEPERPDPLPPHEASDFGGFGQTVVVIDDGWSAAFDQSALVFEADFSGTAHDLDASVSTVDSHGSWVAQSVGLVAPEAGILHLKVFPEGAETASYRDVEEALAFVVEHGPALDVVAVNLSLGGGHAEAPTLSRLSDEFAALDALGILSIVAAGNGGLDEGPGVSVLASDPSVIGVSAVDGRGAFAGFSQRHPEFTDIAAPGTGITIETLDGVLLRLVGTSFAAPLVAGAVAVVQEAAEAVTGARLPPDEVLGILRESGEPVAGTGADAPLGYRIAHAEAAAALVIESFPEEPDTILF